MNQLGLLNFFWCGLMRGFIPPDADNRFKTGRPPLIYPQETSPSVPNQQPEDNPDEVNPDVLAVVPDDVIELPPDEAELILDDTEFFL